MNTVTLNMYVSMSYPGLTTGVARTCMLNTRGGESNTVFYLYLACLMNNMYVSMSYPGLARRNTVFIFVWLRHRKT